MRCKAPGRMTQMPQETCRSATYSSDCSTSHTSTALPSQSAPSRFSIHSAPRSPSSCGPTATNASAACGSTPSARSVSADPGSVRPRTWSDCVSLRFVSWNLAEIAVASEERPRGAELALFSCVSGMKPSRSSASS
eukprot:2825270-Rhodomonas_salina.1